MEKKRQKISLSDNNTGCRNAYSHIICTYIQKIERHTEHRERKLETMVVLVVLLSDIWANLRGICMYIHIFFDAH